MELRTLAARYRLGEVWGEDLPDVAVDMLQVGIDSQAIRELAGHQRPTLRDLDGLFERVLCDAGQPLPSVEEAQRVLLSDVLERVIRGETDPGDGAYEAWWRACKLPGDEHLREEWLRLVGLASEYEDHPDLRSRLAVEIIAAVRAALAILDAPSA